MSLPIDLGLLESDKKFQQMCFRLAQKEFPTAIPVGIGWWDGGRDIVQFNDGGGDVVWQCKFTQRSLSELKPRIVKSLESLAPSREISRWILCLSVEASGAFLDWLRETLRKQPIVKSWEVWDREVLLKRLDQHRDVLEVFFYPVWKSLESRFRTEELELVRYELDRDCGWKPMDSSILSFFQKGTSSDLVVDLIVRNRGTLQALLQSIRLEIADVRRYLRGLPGTGLLWPQHSYTISLHGGAPGIRTERLEPPLVVDPGAHQRFRIKFVEAGYAWTGYVRLALIYGSERELILPWTFLKA
ncbi:MAG: hypothetical protein L0387_37185 [Acidobacteria bacterium]|nr:hypothetical protein [Acidobacteriota bacterium]